MLDAVGFLTIFGGARQPSPRAVAWFGPVGIVMGATLGLLWWGAGNVWPPAVAGAVVVAADLVITGLLHADGLADTADGVLPHLERRRRLEVMAAPDVGAFGIAAVSAVLLLRFAALATTDPQGWRALTFLAGAWCASRALMGVTACRVPYARDAGLATAFLGAPAGVTVLSFVAAVPLAATRGVGGVVALVAGLGAGAGVVVVAWRRLGGFTGDVLGAAGMIAETIALVVISARW